MLPDTIRNIIAVGAGSFIGGIARYLVSLAMKGFPWAEALIMLQTGQIWGFASYIALSILAGIALVALGYYIGR